jgi:hypothetical protein
MRSARLSEFISTGLATVLVLRSLFGLGLSGLPVRSSSCRGPKDFDILGFSSLSLSLLSRVSPLCRRCRRFLHQALWQQLPPLRSLPLRRYSGSGQPLTPEVTSSGLRCLLSVSHALKASIHPLSPGPVSCRSRPWGFPFRVDFHSPSGAFFQTPYPLVVDTSPGLRLGLSASDQIPRTCLIICHPSPL